MAETRPNGQFALCIENKDCEDLEKRKIYMVVPDEEAQKEGYLRVIDESGEDYLYPASYFILVPLPAEAQKALDSKELRATLDSQSITPWYGTPEQLADLLKTETARYATIIKSAGIQQQ